MNQADLFLQDLALVLLVAAVVTVLFRLLRQPAILGYLLAGLIVGPNVPIPLFADTDRVHTLANLGVILVMFSIGLEFSVHRLVRLLPTAGPSGLIPMSGMIWLGYAAGQMMGWSGVESLFAGSMIAVSSTIIVARTLGEQKVDPAQSEIVFGVLVVQDLGAVLLLALLTTVAGSGASAPGAVALAAAKLAGFLVAVVAVGLLLIPRAMVALTRLRSDETLLIASVGLSFALALLALRLGYSVALGAFLAGSLVAESGQAHRIEHLIAPLRDLFAAVFFVAVGMLVDPAEIARQWPSVLLLASLVWLAQPTLIALGSFLAGHSMRSSIRAGMSLAQIGEFSFILAGIGTATGAIGSLFYPVAVAVCLLTSFTTPWMVRRSEQVAVWIEGHLPRSIQTTTALYTSWRAEIRQHAARDSTGGRIRRMALWLVVDVAALAGIVIAASVAAARWLPLLAGRLAVPSSVALAALVAIAAALAAPFATGAVRLARSIGGTVASLIMPPGGVPEGGGVARRALVVTIQLTIALLVGLPLLALTQPFLPAWVGLPALTLGLLVLTWSFWRSAQNLDEQVTAGALRVIEALLRQASTPPGAGDPPPDAPPLPAGLGDLVAVRLEPSSPAVGQTLVALDLRGVTGASVIAISHGGATAAAPTGRETLSDGDILSLAGTPSAMAQATALLLGRAADEDPPAPPGNSVQARRKPGPNREPA